MGRHQPLGDLLVDGVDDLDHDGEFLCTGLDGDRRSRVGHLLGMCLRLPHRVGPGLGP